jgi:antitoxin (DNA-binding transcriptional repressor) of toxin-antitoxin stability system
VITASKLRENVYRILDEILATGEPVEIERNGQILRIVPAQPPDRLARLPRRPDAIAGDSDDLDQVSFAQAWNPEPTL